MITKSLPGPVVGAVYSNGKLFDYYVTKVESDRVTYGAHATGAQVTDTCENFVFGKRLVGLPPWLKAGAKVYQRGVNEQQYFTVVRANLVNVVFEIWSFGSLVGVRDNTTSIFMDDLSTGLLYHTPKPVTKWLIREGVVVEVYEIPVFAGVGMARVYSVNTNPDTWRYCNTSDLCSIKNQAIDELVRLLTVSHETQVAKLRSDRDA